MDIERKPFNTNTTISRMEGFGSPDEYNPYNHTIPIQERGGWLSVDAATAEMWIRVPLIHLTYEDFPVDYIPSSGNTATTTATDVPTVSFENVQSVGIYIQEFADADAAQTALEQLTETAEPDGTRSLMGVDYQKMFHIGEEETTYADINQTGEFIIAFDLHEKQWDRRELQDLTDVDFSKSGYDLEQELDANASVVDYSSVFSGSFLDVTNIDSSG
jgi:hypothetical protein